jgi:hypothetical protein
MPNHFGSSSSFCFIFDSQRHQEQQLMPFSGLAGGGASSTSNPSSRPQSFFFSYSLLLGGEGESLTNNALSLSGLIRASVSCLLEGLSLSLPLPLLLPLPHVSFSLSFDCTMNFTTALWLLVLFVVEQPVSPLLKKTCN